MGEGACFIKAVLHVVNESEQRTIICNNLRLIPLDGVQTVFRLSPSLISHFHRFRRAAESASFPPGEAERAGAEGKRAETELPFHILDSGNSLNTVCTLLNGTSSKSLPLGFPRGCCKAQRIFQNNDCRWQSYLDSIAGSRRLTEEGWRQPKYCLHFVQWYQLKVIVVFLPLFRIIYHIENGFYKTSTLSLSPNPL